MYREIHTGGQLYLAKVFSYLKRKKVSIVPIYLDDFPQRYRRLGLFFEILICNLWLFSRVRDIKHLNEIIFLEDVYFRPRLLLFNVLIRLFNGKLNTVVLVQNVFTNHPLLKNPFFSWIDNILSKVFFLQASLIFSNSDFIKRHVISRGADESKARLIYCSYEELNDKKDNIAVTSEPSGKFKRILFVGQCEPYKGVDVLLRAIADLNQREKGSFVVDIVGNKDSNTFCYNQLLRKVNLLSMFIVTCVVLATIAFCQDSTLSKGLIVIM